LRALVLLLLCAGCWEFDRLLTPLGDLGTDLAADDLAAVEDLAEGGG
jgi:hypothetical protein